MSKLADLVLRALDWLGRSKDAWEAVPWLWRFFWFLVGPGVMIFGSYEVDLPIAGKVLFFVVVITLWFTAANQFLAWRQRRANVASPSAHGPVHDVTSTNAPQFRFDMSKDITRSISANNNDAGERVYQFLVNVECTLPEQSIEGVEIYVVEIDDGKFKTPMGRSLFCPSSDSHVCTMNAGAYASFVLLSMKWTTMVAIKEARMTGAKADEPQAVQLAPSPEREDFFLRNKPWRIKVRATGRNVAPADADYYFSCDGTVIEYPIKGADA